MGAYGSRDFIAVIIWTALCSIKTCVFQNLFLQLDFYDQVCIGEFPYFLGWCSETWTKFTQKQELINYPNQVLEI